jgi:very-short-patch-repair endonuclease
VTPDQQLFAIASRQHGCATVTQALACGLSLDQVDHQVRVGRLERVGKGVVRTAGSYRSWEQALMAGLLTLGPEALVSQRAAGALHRFDGFHVGPVEFLVPRRRRNLAAAWPVHSTRKLDKIDRSTVGLFPCTSPARTIVDLAGDVSERELEGAIDSAVRDGLTSPAFLEWRLTALRSRGRRGVRLLDELLPDSGGNSDLERRFLALVRKARLPRPMCQEIFRRDGKTIARVDFRFLPTRVIAEVSGRRGHASDAERAKDARRRNELQEVGFVVLEFTNRQVRDDEPYVVRSLRAHLG